jgi:hypothetical protein
MNGGNRHSIPATLRAAIGTWAAQKRELYVGRSESIPSVMGKLKYQQSAAGEGEARRRQRWPEVYTGDGLAVQMIVLVLPELPRITLTFYHVLCWPWQVPVNKQAVEIGIPTREYWRQLELAETAVDTALQVVNTVTRLAEQRAHSTGGSSSCLRG